MSTRPSKSGGRLESIPANPEQFEEAIKAFRRRVPVTPDEYSKLTDNERAYALKIAAVTQARQAEDVFRALDKAIAKGTTLEDFKADMADVLPAMSGYRLESMFRTNVMDAYNQGRHAVFTSPTVKRLRPYWRFDGVGDARQSDICEDCDGTVLPADDPFWNTHQPPLHVGCRSRVTALTPEEADDEGIDDGPPDTENEPAEGFGEPPPKSGRDFDIDWTSFRPEIRDALKDRVRDLR